MRSLTIRPRVRPGRGPARLLLALLLASALACLPVRGQGVPEPRREQLLNGLRVLIVHRPADPNLLFKLRLHSGAAFDLEGREGMMSLLAAVMFDEEDFRFVEEDLGGRLEVAVDYDAVNVTVSAPAREFERVLGLLRAGLTNPQLTAETVKRLRDEYRADINLEKLASELVIDAVIPTRELRREVARRFDRYAQKHEERPRKKHLVPPV